MSFFRTPTRVQTIWQGVKGHPTFRWIKMLIFTTSCCYSPQSIVLLAWSGKNTAGRKLWQVFSKRLSLFCSLCIFSELLCFLQMVLFFFFPCALAIWPEHCINSERHTTKRLHSHFKDIKNVPNDSPQSKVCCTAASFYRWKLQWVCINWGTKLTTVNKTKHNQVFTGIWDGSFAEQQNISTLWDRQIVRYYVLIERHSNLLHSCIMCI